MFPDFNELRPRSQVSRPTCTICLRSFAESLYTVTSYTPAGNYPFFWRPWFLRPHRPIKTPSTVPAAWFFSKDADYSRADQMIDSLDRKGPPASPLLDHTIPREQTEQAAWV